MQKTYDLFISYARQPDYRLARDLDKFLEEFHSLPVGDNYELRELDVCRDGGDFSLGARERRPDTAAGTDSSVGAIIKPYLETSRRLLVLCSANAAKSPWVNQEIDWFLETHEPDSIVVAITEGNNPAATPDLIFPERIIQLGLNKSAWYDFRGYRTQPAWYDLRGKRQRTQAVYQHQDFDEARVQLAADLNNLSAGEIYPLWLREKQKSERRRRVVITLVAVVILALLVVTTSQFLQAESARQDAVAARDEVAVQLAESLADQAERQSTPGNDIIQAFHLALRAAQVAPEGHPQTPLHVARVLHLAVSLPVRIVDLKDADRDLLYAMIGPEQEYLIAMMSDFTVGLWDLSSGQRLAVPIPAGATIGYPGDPVVGGPGEGRQYLEFSEDGHLAKAVIGGDTLWIWEVASARRLAKIQLDDFETARFYENPRFSSDGQMVVATDYYCEGQPDQLEGGCCRVVLWSAVETTPSPVELNEPCDEPEYDPFESATELELVYRGRRPVLAQNPDDYYDGQLIERATGNWITFGMSADQKTVVAVSRRGRVNYWDRSATPLVQNWELPGGVDPVAVRVHPAGDSLLILSRDGRFIQQGFDGRELWSAAIGGPSGPPEFQLGAIWPVGQPDTFLVTYGADEDREGAGPGWLEIWQPGEPAPVHRTEFSGWRIVDLVMWPEGDGGIVEQWGEEEYNYLSQWTFTQTRRSETRNVIKGIYGGISRDGRVLFEGSDREVSLLDPLTGELVFPPFNFNAGRGIGGKAAMAILRQAHDLQGTATGVIATLPTGQLVELQYEETGARLELGGQLVRGSVAEERHLLSPDGQLMAGILSYSSGGGQIGSMEDLVIREVESGRVLAGHYRLRFPRVVGFTPGNKGILVQDYDGGLWEYFVHGGYTRTPDWYETLGPALTGTRMLPNFGITSLTPDEHRQMRDQLRSQLEAAGLNGDQAARFILSHFFRDR